MSEIMKNIYSISIVKNEADIIESFIRYNYSYLDGMMIINHNSGDCTGEIIEKLIEEDYNIYYVEWDEIMHQQGNVLTRFIYELIDERNPDIIVPIDADEFLVSDDNKNPRKELEKLDLDYVHHIDWKTYIPYTTEKFEEFIPKNMKYIRNEAYNEHEKVIIPSKLFKDLELELANGNHYCHDLPKENKKKCEYLKMAHYPVRSKDQLISNTLIGALNTLCIPFREKRRSWHRLALFKEIEEGKNLDLIKIAHEYSSRVAQNKPPILNYEPMNIDFCENIEIKYSNISKIDIQNNLIKYSKDLAEEFRAIKEENIELKNKLNKKNKQINELKQPKIAKRLKRLLKN
jgi:glycosyl transferase family 2